MTVSVLAISEVSGFGGFGGEICGLGGTVRDEAIMPKIKGVVDDILVLH